MSDQTVDRIAGFIGIFLVTAFVLGLAEGISSGLTGFWGGLPFWIIGLAVLPLAVYDYWTSCIRRKK